MKSSSQPIERMRTITDVATLLQVSQKTIRRWLTVKELIGHQIGRQWRISEDDLRTFIRQRRQS